MLNNQEILQGALDFANEEFSILQGILIKIEDIVFEERTIMNCFYCGRYGQNWKCPPNLPRIDYQKMLGEFSCGALVYVKIPLDETNYDDVRNNSSIILHKGLLRMEKYLWNHDNSTYLSFIAGGCKLCKGGCGEKHCNNPYQSRSPVEAIGINVVETAKKYNLHITFPPVQYMVRCGLLVW
ncbi:MAG: DUF2284 domain-containing protein [Lachnospiraceae bacterium]|nr:DUF2284 domain-containing protein [Lachnospiraceae bacterium]